jgi:hypothetical protein
MAVLLLGVLGFGNAVAGDPTGAPMEYRVLQNPPTGHFANTHSASTKPLLMAKPAQPYAYGWFGARTQMHWSRQFGNRRTHTQWTLK